MESQLSLVRNMRQEGELIGLDQIQREKLELQQRVLEMEQEIEAVKVND